MGTHTNDFSDADTFHSGILQTQKRIEEIAFCDNYIATQQALSDLREQTVKVGEFDEQLKELKKKEENEDAREKLSFELLVLEDYGLQKQRCLEESLYVSDLENVLQNVEKEITERARYLIERPKVFESVYRGQDLNIASRLHKVIDLGNLLVVIGNNNDKDEDNSPNNTCTNLQGSSQGFRNSKTIFINKREKKDSVYAVRNAWSWVRQVASCVEQHLNNAADYHQYFYDVRHLHEDMSGFLSWLGCVRMRRKIEARDPDTMIDHIRTITNHLLDYQLRAEKLYEQSRVVYPLHHRTEPITHPLKAKALICYQHQDILILKDETCTLLENTEPKWKIRNSRGKEGEVPAVLLVIPPPDSRACSEIVRLREQLLVLWKAAVPSLRTHIIAFLNKIAKDTHTKELQTFSASEKTATMKLLNEAVQLFRASSSDQTYRQFQHQIAGIRKILSQIRIPKQGNVKDKPNSAAYNNTWYKAERVVMMYKNLLSYCNDYEDVVNSKTGREDILIQPSKSTLTYTSKAYFERAKPVEIDEETKESSTVRVDAEIYISERFSPLKQMKQSVLDAKLLKGQPLTNGHALDMIASKEVKSHKMKSFVITAVLDPNTQKKLSLLKAFSNGILDQVRGTYNNPETNSSISIPEAISRGYVIVEYKDEVNMDDCLDHPHNKMDISKSHIDSSSIPVAGIVDPRTGEIVSVKEAISSGILDMKAAKYINPVTREEMTILDAMKNGYIQVEADVIANLSEPGTFTHFQLEDVTYIVDSVTNPTTNTSVSLKRALHENLLDGTNGVYKNPLTGETMPVSEAIAKGFLNARIFNPALDKNDMNTISVKELRVKQEQYIAAHTEAALLNCDLDEDLRPDPNIALYQKLSCKIDVGLKGIKDPQTLRTLSIEEAYHKGILNVGKARYDMLNGEEIALPEATAMGLITPPVLKEVLCAYEESSLGRLIQQEVFDSETGLVTDIASGQTLSLHAAVQQEILNPEMTYFYEVPSNKILSLSEAIESGRYDMDTGKYVKPDTSEELCFSKAVEDKLIRVDIDPKEMAQGSESLAHLRHFMNTEVRGVHMPNSDVVSIDEAVRAGVLNLPEAVYVKGEPKESIPLIKAAKEKKIETPVVVQLFGALNKMSLGKKLNDQIHPVSGQVSSPDTGGPLCIQEATNMGLIKPNYIFFVDQQTGDIASLGSFIDQGKFDPVTGKFLNPTKGNPLTITQAIQEGLIDPSVTAEKYIENESSLRELIDERKINPRNSVFLAPEGQEIPLRDAMADGFLTMNSKVRIDPVSGRVMLASDEEVVRALVRVKEKTAWLQEVEKFLVDQTKPSEKLNSLKKQQGEHKTIHKDLEKEEPVVKSTLAHAEELLGTSNQSKKVEKDQQYQKLKYNTSDLKVRFDAASNEAETRTKKFDDLYEDLEDFYNTVEELDQWMDTAIEKGHGIKVSENDPEIQYELFKKHVEELKAKESEISDLVKLADKFRDDTQEFMNGVDRYRKHVHILPTIKEETEESAMIDDEIEALEDKFRDLSQKCSRYLEKLCSVVKHRKGFNELTSKLESIYPELESKISQIDEESSSKNPKEMSRDLESLKYLKANLLNQEKRVRDLQHVGTKLADELTDLNMKPLAGEIKKTMEEKKATHKSLCQNVESKEGFLSSALTESKSVIKKLDNLNSWVSVTEELLSSKSPICLDEEKLEEQLREQRRIHGDVGSYRALLENLSKEAHDMDGAEDKLSLLDERMENLEKLSNSRILELEGIIGNIEDLHDQMNDMKSWLTSSIDSIHQKPKGNAYNPHLFKAKIDALYAEKKGKESDMDGIKQLAKEIMEKQNVSNGYQLKETVAGVQEQWHELTELLVQEVSLEALTEIEGMLRYMDKAENEINTAEPVSSDPETLAIQLRDHKVFHNDLNSKRNAVKEIISKCNRMLRETTNTQTEAIKSRLDNIQTQADIVCQLSSDRLQHLESAFPLASHFSENQAEILAWLDEMEAELRSQGTSGENLDQVKKQLDNLKVTQQIIEDHKAFVEDLSDTGLELIELCGDEDADDLQGKLTGIGSRYDSLKTQAREKAHDLNENRKLMTQEVSDTLENLLEDLADMEQTVLNADPIPAPPEKLRDEIDENKRIMERLHKHQPHVENARDSVSGIANQGVEDEDDIEEMKMKVNEICKLAETISTAALERDRQLNQARKMSTKFYDLCSEVSCNMKDLKDNLYSQEPPGIDAPTIKEQQKELMEIKQQQENAVTSIKDCHRYGEKLSGLCGDPGKIEVQKQLEDLGTMVEDLNDATSERSEELNLALGHAYQFQVVLDAIMSWLPVSQHKLSTMKSPSTDKTVLKVQIEELKLFKMQTHPHVTDVDCLNQHMTALNDLSPVAAESLLKPVDDVNERWKDLLRGIADREASLHSTQVKVGELEHAIESIMSNLENSKKDLSTLDNIIGDPKCIETQMKKLQLIQDDLKNQSSNVLKLNKTVSNLATSTEDEKNSSLQDKTLAMNKLLREVQVSARDHENKLQETLREVKKFTGDVDDILHWVNDLRMELKSKSPFGALPDAAKLQLESFNKRCNEVEVKEDGVKSLLLNGQDMIDRCRPEDVRQLSEKLRKLKDRWYETKNRALRRRDKMKEHLSNVEDFHSTLKEFTDWLNNAETTMRTFKYPSKIVEKIQKQIEEHIAFKNNVQSYAERMHKLDRTGTYLKYFGRKQDTIYIKNLLVGIRLRWKKLLRRTDERGRLLNQANCENKRFYESWKSLCDWLDSSEKMLSSFLTPHHQMPSNGQATKMKEDMEELKKKPVDMDTQINQLLRVKLFQHQLAAKHPSYYSTTRLGRNLKDRCTKTDNDRDVLQAMLDQLKNKWNLVRSIVSKSQNKLDEALLTSGRVSDALNSLQEWLSKAETTLSEDLPILGDYDTVNLLIEQHKSVQQELLAREQTLEAVKSAGNVPDQHLEDLITLWNRINLLSENRETRLKEALTLADEFQEVVQVMREFLPTAEAELKFRPLPDDEFAIIHLIERHEKFQEQLRNHQDTVDKIKTLAEEILLNCHPNAVRFVKYYLTITQTRWDQLVQRARSRAQRLQEALKSIQGNAALLEELLAWLTDAQVLLATKEKDPIPHDLNVVETLLKEHLELHEEVTSKNADVDRLTKIVTCESKLSQGRHYGSNWKLNEMDGHNPRVATLQTKWRTVWRMSVDRKKKLQDALDTLLELESFKNFDFDLWRQRYLSWIQEKKFRITDFFRRQDKDCDGALTRREFVDGMLQSKFPTNKTELNAVFDIFDHSHTGRIDNRNFIDAMKPDRHKTARMKTSKRQATDSEMIHDEIERQISSCQCRHQFKAERIDEGQYRFGENLKLKLVRFLNSCVMVRVGGGWVTLEQFLETNDPCRAKGRTTTELRESFVLADGVSQARAAFRSKTPEPHSKKRLSEGYASSNSSAGSCSSPLRRSKMGTSMINLSVGSPSTLYDHPDFGSTGSLSRSKRLSSSSNSLSSTKSPRTPKTPVSTISNSRPKTPTANSKPSPASGSSTPRSRSVTPNPTRSVTPNPSRMGASRRLPTTPKTPTRPKTPTTR